MINSKSLKPKKFRWMYEDESKSFFQNLAYLFKKYLVWPIADNYRITKERLGRSYAHARFGWLNYDFDMACVWHLFEFKLKRLRECLKNGHAIQQPEDMAALRELIKIVRRLGMERYENKYYRIHDKKWGKIESRTTPNYDDKGEVTSYSWRSWRKNCPENAPKKLKDKERKDMKRVYENAEKDRIKDIERMAEILVEHGQHFWD